MIRAMVYTIDNKKKINLITFRDFYNLKDAERWAEDYIQNNWRIGIHFVCARL